MNRTLRFRAFLTVIPLAVVLLLAIVPLVFLLAHSNAAVTLEWASLWRTLAFTGGGAFVGTMIGGALAVGFGTHRMPGQRWLLLAAIAPIAAPPAFWWIGATRLTTALGNASGPAPAAIIAGLALAPVTLVLVLATVRQLPSNVYEAARLTLRPSTRVRAILLPLIMPSLLGGFLLTVILLLGESELPFLFGFRTVMTDVVTTFSQTFDVRRVVPLTVPLLLTITALGIAAGRPILRTVFASSRGAQGVNRTSTSSLTRTALALPVVAMAGPILGYTLAALRGGASGRIVVDTTTIVASVTEAVGCAWFAIALALLTAHPARRSRAAPIFVWASLLVFCVPAGIYAIGWLAVGQSLGGYPIHPFIAHAPRGVAVAVLAFFLGYARVPRSLEDAGALAWASHIRRAHVIVLPLMVGSLAAAAALIAALTYADRDVASLLLAPGASRLTLNLYLASANAPSATLGTLALVVLGGAAASLGLAAAAPAILWWHRG